MSHINMLNKIKLLGNQIIRVTKFYKKLKDLQK